MSWDRIEGHRSPCADTVRIAVHNPSGCNPYHQMRVHLGRGVLDRLQWSVGINVDAFHGTGKDHGRMSIRLSQQGRFRLMAKRGAVKGSVFLSTNRLPPGALEKPMRVMTAKYSITPDGLEIEMPQALYGLPKHSSVRKSVDTQQNSLLTARPNGNGGV